MTLAEIDVFGVCVAPLSLMIPAAWILLVLLRQFVGGFNLAPRVWHPPLFWSTAYVILLASMVLLVAK